MQSDEATASFESSTDKGNAFVDPLLWKRFTQAKDSMAFAQAWLDLECAQLIDCRHASVMLADDKNLREVAHWPSTSHAKPNFQKTAQSAMAQASGVLLKVASDASVEVYHLAHPINIDQIQQGVVLVEVAYRKTKATFNTQLQQTINTQLQQTINTQLQQTMRQLQWGVGLFKSHLRKDLPSTCVTVQKPMNAQKSMTALYELIVTALDHQEFVAAATAVATGLASHFKAERVTIGFLHKNHIQVRAFSHTAHFDKRTNLVRAIGMAMDEAMDQKATIVYSESTSKSNSKSNSKPNSKPNADVNRAHESLIQLTDANSACSVPFVENGKVFGVLSIEHIDPDFFIGEKQSLLEQVGLLIAPILELKRLESRWLIKKGLDAGSTSLKKLFGPRHYRLKATTLLVILALCILTLCNVDHRVSADAALEGWTQRSISAPYDGYISSSDVKAGDVVKRGDTLFSLDDRDLELERLKWFHQRQQVDKQYREALTERNKARVGILRAQLDQAKANLQLIEKQMARAQVLAPIDGLIVKGDLSQELGAPVGKGEALMQITPLNAYRVNLKVDERDIIHIQLGQTGVVRLSANPDDQIPFVIEKVTPVAESTEGVNSFIVEARITEVSEQLRPGMQGTGKVHVGNRTLGWVWFHPLVDWLQLWVWSWWP